MKELKYILNWYAEHGVLDFVSENPINHFVLSEKKVETDSPKATTSDRIKSHSMDEIIELLALKHKNNQNKKNMSQNLLTPQEAVNMAREASDKAKSLEELRNAVENFNGCYSIKKLATNTVFGEGDPKAELLIIGEAPGNNEDLQGRPFCGQSGKLLDRMLNAIGYKRENLYITNTLFWRPPGNRTPTPEEIAMCKPFVEKHIALVNPKIILMMGATAFQGLLNANESISKGRRKFYDYQNAYLEKPVKATPLFHPSYLLRQPLRKRDAWKDLLIVKDFLRTIL